MSDDSDIHRDLESLRKAIKKAKRIYVAIMMGNTDYSVRITKPEAWALFEDIEKTWSGSCKELDVAAFGYTSITGDLFLGGF